jgi:dTMP kinase
MSLSANIFEGASALVSTSTAVNRGAFIVFEGIDRCGKSTQCSMLASALKDKVAVQTEQIRFPDRTSKFLILLLDYNVD